MRIQITDDMVAAGMDIRFGAGWQSRLVYDKELRSERELFSRQLEAALREHNPPLRGSHPLQLMLGN